MITVLIDIVKASRRAVLMMMKLTKFWPSLTSSSIQREIQLLRVEDNMPFKFWNNWRKSKEKNQEKKI